jgi:hypothetical protein
VVLIEGIYCEFKSCYSFIVFRRFLFYVDQRLGISISLAVGYNAFYSPSYPV